MLSSCSLDFSVGVRAFVKGPSQIASFFSLYVTFNDISATFVCDGL